MTRDRVKNSVENFVERIASGGASPEEISVFPAVLSVYCEFYRGRITDEVYEKTTEILPLTALSSFPMDGLVGVKQVASFLGLSENSIWQKLRTDSEFPQPSVRERRRTRWDASKIREYRQKTDAA
jgi:predicted DNA-binding transcriptional regulator AlpA